MLSNTFTELQNKVISGKSKVESTNFKKVAGISLMLLIGAGLIYTVLFTGTDTPDRKTQSLEKVTPLIIESRKVIDTEQARIEESEAIIKQTDSLLICSTSYADTIEECKQVKE